MRLLSVSSFSRHATGLAGALLLSTLLLPGAQSDQPVALRKGGGLAYTKDAKGNRVPDFSAAGYGGGGVVLPQVAGKVVMSPSGGDDAPALQSAIDYVSNLPVDENGFRGAVVLTKGRFSLSKQIMVRASGVVLRGAGAGEGGTVLYTTATDRRPVLEVKGSGDRDWMGAAQKITADYVPAGSEVVALAFAGELKAGDHIRIRVPSTKEWIKRLEMDEAPARSGFFWRPGTLDFGWDRQVVSISGNSVTLDAPLTAALETNVAPATLQAYRWAGRLEKVGVEYLRFDSAFDHSNPKDEQHAWIAVQLNAVENAWVREVTATHFVSSAVYLSEGASRVTVTDCASLQPISELAGYRRMAFFTAGQQTLFVRCRAESALYDFVAGYLAAGPNVFLECKADDARGFSGSVGSWATGLLFDNVVIDGGELRLDNLETWNQGVGWAAGYSMLWQSKAARIVCRNPPGATNWASGVWAMFVGDGAWSKTSEFVDPDSLYRAQLNERRGANADKVLDAAPLVEKSTAPRWDDVAKGLPAPAAPNAPQDSGLTLTNGWLVSDGKLLIGTNAEVSWWRGQLAPGRAPEENLSLTRFVPGRVGLGLTDDLEEVASAMNASNRITLRHHWGLWYDRRSDDHQMVRRPDAQVWPPFFDQPWVRSGQGEAWDRLSKYDLLRFNPWYFGRLREFADIARAHRVVLVNEMFFQHNILEAGAHWASFPVRPANAIQETGFPEPPPYVGDKRNFMAQYFYDLSNPVRREIYTQFIRHSLENLAPPTNVIHTTGAEYTGPLSFMQFWLDTVSAWTKETGRHPLIALSAPKDVQDAILEDATRRDVISVVDFTYWYLTDKGLFAPKSGQNLAPRQSEREWKGGKPSAVSMAKMVREYRGRFPEKAIIAGIGQPDGWAFLAAGGSFPSLPATTDEKLLRAIPGMKPVPGVETTNVWMLGETGKQYVVYAAPGTSGSLDLRDAVGTFVLHPIDPKTGIVAAEGERLTGGKRVEVTASKGAPLVAWITRETNVP